MIRILALLTLAFWDLSPGYAQDTVFTADKRVFTGEILDTAGAFVRIKIKDGPNTTFKALPKTDVERVGFGPYVKGENKSTQEPSEAEEAFGLRGSISFGISRNLASLPANLQPWQTEYLKKLQRGYSLDASLQYFTRKNSGFGLLYMRQSASNRLDMVTVTGLDQETGQYVSISGEMSDNIQVNYIGPTYSKRSPIGNSRIAVFTCLSLGYVQYRNNLTMILPGRLTANTFGLAVSANVDFPVSETAFLFIQARLVRSSFKSYRIEMGGESSYETMPPGVSESLDRLDGTIGLSLRIK